VHFLVAAAELHLSVHDFGRRKDAAAEWARALVIVLSTISTGTFARRGAS
jgi:hypothetical protein